ncbi:unnamed protein product [Rotaria sp. Silwood1]|nr:unnamed protein product [Rotaria sp. Silwood1]
MRVATVCPINKTTIEPDRKRHEWRSIIQEFALNTSTHGIPGIARSQISEWPQNFPAFTICNVARIRYDQFIIPFLNYTNELNITNTNDTTSFSLLQAKYVNEFFRLCSASDFTSFSSSSYGLCYTFNAKLKNMTDVRKSNEYGGSGKLELSFYVHSHQYVPYTTEDIGMIGMVHDNTQFPMIEFAGRALVTGFKHRMTYAKKTIFYLRAPYTTCNDEIPPTMQAMFDSYPDVEYVYSEDLCYDLCTEVYTYYTCGCIDPKQWNARSILLPQTDTIIVAPLCNISDTCHTQAAIVLMNSSTLLEKYCSYCSQQCSITDFIVKSSMWKAPADWLMNDIKTFVKNSGILLPKDWSTNWHSHIHSNYLSIELVHESILVENYTQIPAMGPVTVLSDVGGQTGLWIGISFLSLLEVAEMFYRLIQYQYYAIQEAIRTCIKRN